MLVWTSALLFVLPQGPVSGGTVDAGRVAFRQACLDATTDALVLNVAAHPDDEADRTLVWLRHRLGARTVTLYTTCGQGGQNAIGREIGLALARIRVRETLAAARHTGVDVRWLGMPDFGYSKTADETHAVWGEAELVARTGTVIDDLDPDVVLTNHGPERGHGHHRATALALRRVLLDGPPSRARPLFERVFGEDTEHDWSCDPHEIDPVRGVTYARQASIGRHEHRTQGPWSPHRPLRASPDRWRLVTGEASSSATPLRDVRQCLRSVLDAPTFAAAWRDAGHDLDALRRALAAFALDRPVAEHVRAARELLPPLRAVAAALATQADQARVVRRLWRRIDALERVVVAGSGVWVETWLADARLQSDGRGVAQVIVHAADPAVVTNVLASCRGSVGVPIKDDPRGARALRIEFAGPRPPPESLQYAAAFEPEWVHVDVAFAIDGLPMNVSQQLPADRVADVEVSWGRDEVYLPIGDDAARAFTLTVRHHGAEPLEAAVELELPAGVDAEVSPRRLSLSPERAQAEVLVRLRGTGPASAARQAVRARVAGATASMGLERLEARVGDGFSVGLIAGPDDTLRRTLADLGIRYRELDAATLAAADLADDQTVVLDLRAYYHRPDLAHHRERLLRFCRQGGRVLAFYHKPGEWNARPGRPSLAPFELEVGRARASEEDAEVRFLRPEHALLNEPHPVTKRDFDGWVQERGLNFPKSWGPEWTPLLAMADTGEEIHEGALLYAQVGEGDFVYCSLALYRQLRVGHRGAARLLVNLLNAAPADATGSR
ncbi:MAG: PIG-L family deacetylase [Planctomycetota bacterium]